MYINHFGLTDKPFKLIPDPDYLYLSGKHSLGLNLLEYGLLDEGSGLTVISGEVGAGKTTLVKKLLKSLDYENLTVGMIDNTGSICEELMSWVVSSFGLAHENRDKVILFREFQKFLIDEFAQGKNTVLIVDEAQNLNPDSLEDLRMLTNINSGKEHLLQIILVGQPQLLEVLSRPELAQIAQRVSVEYHLEALDLKETAAYIRHRLQVAGGAPDIFNKDAVKVIFYFSGGVPRLVNSLCEYSLIHAYASGEKTVDFNAAISVRNGRRIGGINRFASDQPEREKIRESILDSHKIDLKTL